MADVKLSISVEDRHLKRFPDVVQACREAGMAVENELQTIGVITGTIAAEQLERLRTVSGVADVEAERAVGIAPPESEVQ